MPTACDNHEIHCPKRYLECIGNGYFRALRDSENIESYEANYAVLTSEQEVDTSLARIELFYAGTGTPAKLRSAPDAISFDELRPILEKRGYEMKREACPRMSLTAKESPILLVHACDVKCFAQPLRWPERALVDMSADDHEYAGKLIDKQMAGGARAFVAYNLTEVPVSVCLGEAYGSAFAISHVYTAPQYRRKGFGAAVVQGTVQYAHSSGYTEIFLRAHDLDAQGLFEKMGFRIEPKTSEQYWAVQGGLPAWLK